MFASSCPSCLSTRSATDIVVVTIQAQQLKQQLRSAQVAAAGQWRVDTALTLPLFSVSAVHGVSGL